MIYLFSGTPGGGKSLDMARCIINDLKASRPVICNFPITIPNKLKNKADLFYYWDNDVLCPQKLVEFSKEYFSTHKFKEGAICLYIDEAQLIFNARQWNMKGRSEWNAFFTNHRHFGFDIVLTAQFDRMIDRQIRSLIEIEVVHRKVNNMGWKGAFARLVLFAPTLFVRISFYYPLKERLSSTFYRYNSSYGKIYDSFSDIFIDKKEDTIAVPCTPVAIDDRREDTGDHGASIETA